ncbi:ABC transporter ATP-binding protein [Paenibacillus camelliae]|uniref:ABC transporter ATP-binding protein n=1 Tax=Paenibacillus camelliae TaxID=512410 RepID=UPI0020425CCE|nr:ABC transporter ATP-binding protein [Paenibacillus camelliae]MCM3634484.1 ABC transporter ATP-binding protein/permease [Paenibacillus camelliae]
MDSPKILSQFFKKTWIAYVISVTLHAIANIIQVQFPRVLGDFTDALQLGQLTWDGVLQSGWELLAIGISFTVLGGIAQYLVMYTGRYFEYMNRSRLYQQFLQLSERFYASNGVGKLLSYFMNDVTAVRESISMGVNQTAGASMLLISTIVMLLLSNVPLYLVIACIIPLLFIPVIVVWIGPKIKRRSLKVQEALSAMTASAEEQFAGIRVTKKFAVESIMIERFGATVDEIRKRQLRLVRISSLFQATIPFLGALSLIVAMVYGGYLTVQGTITLGTFVALTLYVRMLMNPLQQLGNVINVVQRARASLERLNDLMRQKREIVELEDAKPLDPNDAAIELRNLSFSYEAAHNGELDKQGRLALNNLSLTIPQGTTLGIIGRTGSGKTTLMKLLLRLYDAPVNCIRYGRHDIRSIKLSSLRESIGYVPQDGFLFSTTIRDNIAFSDRSMDDKKVYEAAQHARIYDNIMDFPEQFDTKLGERGVTLSGGQRQRTSLARGMIKDAPILILDDSVSAVDAITETEILSNIAKLRSGRTTIIIANRVSALKHADHIIVLEQGSIIQQGKHEQLLSEDGLYRRLYELQEEGTRA